MQFRILGYESLSVAASAVALTGGETGAKSFVGTVETGAIRMRGDGTDPTTSEGQLFDTGSVRVLSESDIDSAKLIRDTGTSGVLKGHFYNADASTFAAGHGNRK